MLARLLAELRAFEAQPARNASERDYNRFRADQIRADIELVRAGKFKVGAP
jgi:hypothetical protein